MAPPSQPPSKHQKGHTKGEAMKRAAENQGSSPPPNETASAAASAGDPKLQAMFDNLASTFSDRIGNLEASMSRDMGSVSASLDRAMGKMADRMDEHEKQSKKQFEDIHDKIKQLEIRMAAPTAWASTAAASSFSSASGSRGPATPAPPSSNKPDEDCIVFVRGFPVLLPGFVMKEFITEALSILPEDDRKKVRIRSSPADNQFSLVFSDAAKADSFIEGYRAHGFVYIDPPDED